MLMFLLYLVRATVTGFTHFSDHVKISKPFCFTLQIEMVTVCTYNSKPFILVNLLLNLFLFLSIISLIDKKMGKND